MSLYYKYKDLIVNLPSLEFKSIFTDQNINHLPLRSRSHCLQLNAFLHSYYYLSVFYLFSKACYKIINKESLSQLSDSEANFDKNNAIIKVGVIGYGRLGSTLCKDLIEHKLIFPENLYIETRNKEVANKVKIRRINVNLGFHELIKNCHIIFICVLASQLEAVGKKLRSKLLYHQILYVFTTGVTLARLKEIFKHDGIITESYLWNDSLYETWDFNLTVSEAIENESVSVSTCPLPVISTNAHYISCNQKLYTMWIYSLCNIGTAAKLDARNVIKLLNTVFFDSNLSLIDIEDILIGDNIEEEVLPKFSLCSINENLTFLDQKISVDEDLQNGLIKHYQNSLKSFSKNRRFII